MKIALGQVQVTSGKIIENMAEISNMIIEAKKQGADLIVFPELAISGYFLQDRWTDDEWVNFCTSQNEVIKSLSNDIGIIWGNVSSHYGTLSMKGTDGRNARFNSAFFAQNGEWVLKDSGVAGQYVKHLLPQYRVFDDNRFFTSAFDIPLKEENMFSPFLFHYNNEIVRISIQICEDMWNDDYPMNPTAEAIEHQVDFIINISSSPWTNHKEKARLKQIEKHSKINQGRFPYFVYVNSVGMQNTGKNVMVFDGGSMVLNQQGQIVGMCPDDFKAHLAIIDPLSEPIFIESTSNKLFNALIVAIEEFDRQFFYQKPNWIIGLSGGLDSAINAALLTIALGNKRIIAVNLASPYNRQETIDNAYYIAKQLEVSHHQLNIESLVEATLHTCEPFVHNKKDNSLVEENIQARLRGHILSTIASIENGVVINNANKIETALGYCTLYGDTIGAIAPLGDCTKMQLFELAEGINEFFKKEVIPRNLIPKISSEGMEWIVPPSAELKSNQIDPMKWGYHDWLIQMITEYPGYQIEQIMKQYLDGSIWYTTIAKWLTFYGLDDPSEFISDLEWIIKMIQLGVYKRIQMPPIVTISRGSFGSDFRESQIFFEPTHQFIVLKQKILEMPYQR